MKFLLVFILAIALSLSAMASSTRLTNSDTILSSDNSKQYTLPAASGVLAMTTDVPVGAGQGVNYFLDDVASDVSTYFALLKYPNSAIAEQIDSVTVTSASALIEVYASASTALVSGASIEGGEWEFDTWAYTSSITGGTSQIRVDVYGRTFPVGVETFLFSVVTPNLTTTNTLYVVKVVKGAFPGVDRVVSKYYGNTTRTSATTINFTHNGTTRYSFFKTPIQTRHNDLSALQGCNGTGSSGECYHLSLSSYNSIGTEIQETPSGLINGSNKAYTLSYTPKSNASVKLFLDGIIQRQGIEYTVSGTNITFMTAPKTAQVMWADYLK